MKKQLRFFVTFAIGSFCLLGASNVYADIYNCNGEWTNKPCSEKAAKTLPEVQPEKVRSDMGDRRLLVHDLTMRAINLKRQFDEKFDVNQLEKYCYAETTAFDDCRKRVEEEEDRLTKRQADLEHVKAEKEANDLQKQRNKIEVEKPPTQVNIIRKQPVIVLKEDPLSGRLTIIDNPHHRQETTPTEPQSQIVPPDVVPQPIHRRRVRTASQGASMGTGNVTSVTKPTI